MTKVPLPPPAPPPKLLKVGVLKVAKEDLNEIAGEMVRERFWAVIEQLRNDALLQESLRKNFFGEGDTDRYTHVIGVRSITGLRKRVPERDVWRFKIWSLDNGGLKFRFFYAFFETEPQIIILGVADRDDAYELDSPLIQRICSDYDRFGGR
jgi:hypothetical protein